MTTKLVLDGNAIDSEADFHDMIDRAARSAGFVFYGRNLDALWDVLTAIFHNRSKFAGSTPNHVALR